MSNELSVIDTLQNRGVRIESIVFGYSRQFEWVSDECGPNMRYSGLTLIEHSFDSVRIINTEFDNSIDENIRIYN